MGYEFTPADVAYLRSSDGVAAIAEVERLPLAGASYLADIAAARSRFGARAAPLLETVLLRRAANEKFGTESGRLLFTATALQQATPPAVARHRAARLAGRVVHDVTCSIGADLMAIAAVADRCVGSDVDPVRLAMATHNCAVAGVSPLVVRADAVRPVSTADAVFVDPARRDASGRRRWRVADFRPSLDELARVYRDTDLAVKTAPGVDPGELPWSGELELVSLDGQVREACLWTGSLAREGVSRSATVLRSDGSEWTVADTEPDDCPVRSAGEWLVDPDGAVVRAGLVRQYAARHGLGQLDERIAYLTGDTPPPGIRAFRVVEHGHYSEKELRRAVRRLGIGRLEILVRGLDVDPNTLRRRLKPQGDAEMTVVLTRIGRTPTALVCHAVRT